MQPRRVRLTVFRLLLFVVVCAIVSYIVTQGPRRRARERIERCLAIADFHARADAEYRRNAHGDAVMLRIAAWHEHLRRVFEEAANQPGDPIPATQPFPPKGWRGPEETTTEVGM